MRAVIQDIEYEVRFRHTRLPSHDRRVMPTIDDAFSVLAIAGYELDHPGELAAVSIDAKAILKDFLADIVGASTPVSHSTECFILDSDRSKPFDRRLISSGITFCDKRDNFERAEGRLHAFSKAIDAFPESAHLDWIEWLSDSVMRLPARITPPRVIAQCAKAPWGWRCTRGYHVDGPCAAVPDAAITCRRLPPDLAKQIAENIELGRQARQ